MAFPKYNELMLPLLKRLTDNKEHLMSDLSTELTKEFIGSSIACCGCEFHSK